MPELPAERICCVDKFMIGFVICSRIKSMEHAVVSADKDHIPSAIMVGLIGIVACIVISEVKGFSRPAGHCRR